MGNKQCSNYAYRHEVVGLVGHCKLNLFGGLHVVTCYGNGKCPKYTPPKE